MWCEQAAGNELAFFGHKKADQKMYREQKGENPDRDLSGFSDIVKHVPSSFLGLFLKRLRPIQIRRSNEALAKHIWHYSCQQNPGGLVLDIWI
jgi:hypothetical protein